MCWTTDQVTRVRALAGHWLPVNFTFVVTLQWTGIPSRASTCFIATTTRIIYSCKGHYCNFWATLQVWSVEQLGKNLAVHGGSKMIVAWYRLDHSLMLTLWLKKDKLNCGLSWSVLFTRTTCKCHHSGQNLLWTPQHFDHCDDAYHCQWDFLR